MIMGTRHFSSSGNDLEQLLAQIARHNAQIALANSVQVRFYRLLSLLLLLVIMGMAVYVKRLKV